MNETDYGVTFMDPAAIEKRSMEIIESELTVPLSEDIKPIVKRVIHTTADFSFAENMRFTPGVVELIRNMLSSGATLITDTNMALTGISKPSLKCVVSNKMPKKHENQRHLPSHNHPLVSTTCWCSRSPLANHPSSSGIQVHPTRS